MKLRESDPLVMLTGILLCGLTLIVVAFAGLALKHFWQ